jgi:hypothetical protein
VLDLSGVEVFAAAASEPPSQGDTTQFYSDKKEVDRSVAGLKLIICSTAQSRNTTENIL